MDDRHQDNFRDLHSVANAVYCHFRSTFLQIRFVNLRKENSVENKTAIGTIGAGTVKLYIDNDGIISMILNEGGTFINLLSKKVGKLINNMDNNATNVSILNPTGSGEDTTYVIDDLASIEPDGYFIINPNGDNREIIGYTYTDGAFTGEIVRGARGTTGVAHVAGEEIWRMDYMRIGEGIRTDDDSVKQINVVLK